MPAASLRIVLAVLLVSWSCMAGAQTQRAFRVQLPASAPSATQGRLLLFAEPVASALAKAKDGKVASVDAGPFSPGASAAAMDIAHVAPGQVLPFDSETVASPQPFSRLPDGDYYVQAVLDVARDDNYGGRGADDLTSAPQRVTLRNGTAPPVLVLDRRTPPPGDPWTLSDKAPALIRDAAPEARAHTHAIDFTSPKLGAFWGRPVRMRGWVVLPPGYDTDASARYPVMYQTHGFGGSQRSLVTGAIAVYATMKKGDLPPMIYVMLDESSATGTHEFADSVNNGPWGAALTEELIPDLEKRYRMDAKASGRLLNGHSSGGWATLWLQVRYPKLFGGTWSTSPDPSDFHDFTGVDLYAPGANVYRRADGSAYPIMRDKGKVEATFEQFARMEAVIGPTGGQMSSFEWVFSPRGADGRPMPMFDRASGDVDPQVIAYWRDQYDIAHILARDWTTLRPDLDGKLHVYVGDADTFYLDGAARRLKAVLDGLGAKSEFRFVPGKTHFDLYVVDGDPLGLMKDIAWQMYAVARPGTQRPDAK